MNTDEPTMSFPTWRLLGAIAIGGGASLGAIAAASAVSRWNVSLNSGAISGVVLVLAVCGLSVLVMTPWARRTMSAWMTMWLAGTVVRLLLTPIAAFLLYSATLPDRTTFGLAIGLTYLLTLLTEAGVLAGFVHQKLGAASDSPRSE